MTSDEIMSLLNEAVVHHKAGRVTDAEASYRKALEHAPNAATALHNLGLILHAAKKFDEAIPLMERSIEIESRLPIFHKNMGVVYRAADRPEDSAVSLRKALELNLDDGTLWADLGVSLDKTGHLVDALAVYEKAIRLLTPIVDADPPPDPAIVPGDGTPRMELARSHYNLGSAQGRLRKVDESIGEYEAAIRYVPQFGEPHRNRAAVLFQRGNMKEAWAEYEYRWKCADYPGKYPDFKQPTWDGSDLAGKTILIWWEQGFGDTIQFCRYAPLIAARGGRVALLCQKELRRVLETLDSVAELAINGERAILFDTHASLMSLPYLMGTTEDTVPSGKPYLRAAPDDAAEWERRLRADGEGLRVGIVWAGAAGHKNDANRSIPLSMYAPILAVEGVRFYSLQLKEGVKQLADLPPSARVLDHTANIKDFADTAGFLDRLDLLITVDTAVAHLAGAIGKDVWTLLPWEPDFRWMADTDNPSRWYPTMRHFRQQVAGEWKPVIEKVAGELAERVKSRK